MREHTRTNGRYFRTEAGALTLDWGSNGSDYNALDFSYVIKSKMGNLSKIYGQVRRTPDNVTYDTYDIKAGRKRVTTRHNLTIASAIRSHIKVVTGIEVPTLEVAGEMPLAPDTIRLEMQGIIERAVKNWEFCFRGLSKEWSDAQKDKARKVFAVKVWDCGKFFCEPLENRQDYVPMGLLNVDVRANKNLYRLWCDSCEALAKLD